MIISLLIIGTLLLVLNNIYHTDVDASNFTKEVFETKITRDDYDLVIYEPDKWVKAYTIVKN